MRLKLKWTISADPVSVRYWKLFCAVLFAVFIPLAMPGAALHAQQVGAGQSLSDLVQSLTPEQRQALGQLTPDQRQALKDELLKSGGVVTPDLIEKFKARQQGPTQEASPAPTETMTPQEARENRAAAEEKEKAFEEKIVRYVTDSTGSTFAELNRFGLGLLASSRKRILLLEEAISKGQVPPVLQKDALSGFIGPLDMISSSVNASVPPQYVLNPGDRITVYYWGDLIELTTLNLSLDENGELSVPKAGRFVARGMSLPQLQKALQEQLSRSYGKQVKLLASLDKLNSIQIFIVGDAFRPGSYAVSAVTTLFNALYAAGGPNEFGSLRDIRLIRKNSMTGADYYDYLLNGDGRSDLPLQAGDTIFIGRVERLAAVSGEVARPAVFELKKDETLKDLIRMAGNIKPTGLTRVQIQSVVPHQEQAVVDVDLSGKGQAADYALYDGDVVTVGTIVQDILNQVTLEGNVKVPGIYEWKKGMKVTDLFNEVNQPWGEAYLERADIFRLDKDRKTTTIIPFDLGKALQKDPGQNLELAPLDRIVVYSKWDVKYYPDMVVTIAGAVQKPGDYVRAVGMKLKDLLELAGGVLPGASNDIVIAKARSLDEIRTVTVKQNLLEKGDESQNVLLDDMDIVMVRESSDFFEQPRWVEIKGEVKFPGRYPLLRKDYRLSELVRQAGGLTRVANPKGAVFLRKNEFLPSPEQKSDVQTIDKIMNALNKINYQRQAARNILLLKRELGSISPAEPGPVVGPGTASVVASGLSAREAAAIVMGPQIAQSAGQVSTSAMSALTPGSGVASEARVLSDQFLSQSSRVIINLKKGMEGGNGNPDNIILMNGDSITVPQRTETASVVGAVMNPVTLHLSDHRSVKDVVNLAGGYATDADKEGVMVVRVNGAVIPARDVDYAEEGDIIYVPTKVMTTEIVTTTDKIISAVKFAFATAASVIIFLAIIH